MHSATLLAKLIQGKSILQLINPKKPGDTNGFYQVGDRRTYLKTELMDWLHHMPSDWHWNFNDEFFSQFDWKKEPSEDINELYRQRAMEIRKAHDYVILYYSGGHDSSQALYAFLENNIHIDEICIYYSGYDSITNQYKELRGLTQKKVAWLQKKYPNLKVRWIDYGDMFNGWTDIFKRHGFQDNMFDMLGSLLSVNRLIADEFYMNVPDWTRLLEKGKRIGFVWGSDKPMVRYFNDKWIFNFHDAMAQGKQTPMRQVIDDGTIGTYENFYWSPTDAGQRILRKQCHLLAHAFNKQAKEDFSQIPGAKPFKPGYGWEIDTMSFAFVHAIYPRLFRYGEVYFTEKNAKYIFGNRDQWFFESNNDHAAIHKDMWTGLNSGLYSHYNDWMNDKNIGIENGLKNCISQDYVFLENTKQVEQVKNTSSLHSINYI